MEEITFPDLSGYRLHKIIEDVAFEGVAVPDLSGTFYRRPDGARTRSVGVYAYGGEELFMAWGYVGETHCRYSAVRRADGVWSAARRGCPEVGVLLDGEEVAGLAVSLTDGERVSRQSVREYTANVNALNDQLCSSR